MMDNDAVIRCTRDILDECFTNFISGIWPSEDVREDEIGLWFCQMAGEMLTSAFLTDDNMTIEDAIEIGKKLTRLIAFDSEKNSENYKLEFQEYYHLEYCMDTYYKFCLMTKTYPQKQYLKYLDLPYQDLQLLIRFH